MFDLNCTVLAYFLIMMRKLTTRKIKLLYDSNYLKITDNYILLKERRMLSHQKMKIFFL